MLAYLVRHAESLTNARVRKDLNPPLSPLGLQQVERLAQRLSAVKLTAIYCSPFERCLATVEPVAKAAGQVVRIRPELHECYHLSPGQRVANNLAEPDDITKGRSWLTMCEDFRSEVRWPAHDETSDDLLARMRTFADYLKGRWAGSEDAVLVVSHGSPLARLVGGWLSDGPCPSFRYVIDNATVTALRFERGISTLACLNEGSHLLGLPAPEIAQYNADGSIKLHQPPIY